MASNGAIFKYRAVQMITPPMRLARRWKAYGTYTHTPVGQLSLGSRECTENQFRENGRLEYMTEQASDIC